MVAFGFAMSMDPPFIAQIENKLEGVIFVIATSVSLRIVFYTIGERRY